MMMVGDPASKYARSPGYGASNLGRSTSTAKLEEALRKSASQTKMELLADWHSRTDSSLTKQLARQRASNASLLRQQRELEIAAATKGPSRPTTPYAEGAAASAASEEAALAAARRDKAKETAKKSMFVKSASEALNSRFSDMFKAFQYVDLDRSGTLNEKEIRRALDMWNIPMSDDKLQELIAACDFDGDGQVDYKEFVDVLARDTVAPAAMGKRDMQSLEAMGVDSQEMLAHQLGHKTKKQHESISINS